MDDEKFRLSKLNIIFLVVDIIIFILTIVSVVFLVNSFKEENELPNLEVTRERTSTTNTTTTTEYVPPTTTTTTRRNLNSPYYEVNVSTVLNEELLKKKELTKEEALMVMKTLYETVDKIFNISDNSLLDIATTIEYVKEGEKDVITFEDNKYGIIYNSDELLKKCFSNYFLLNEIGKYRFNQKRIFIKRDNEFYRIQNILGNIELVKSDFIITQLSSSSIEANMRYYKSNYKELGYSSPVYQLMNFKATYERGSWKITSIDYPLTD